MNQPIPSAAAFPTAQSTQSVAPGLVLDAASCPRCGGIGHISHFRHVERGRCFRCQGSGKLSVLRAA